jgi:hypothetical protein
MVSTALHELIQNIRMVSTVLHELIQNIRMVPTALHELIQNIGMVLMLFPVIPHRRKPIAVLQSVCVVNKG